MLNLNIINFLIVCEFNYLEKILFRISEDLNLIFFHPFLKICNNMPALFEDMIKCTQNDLDC